MYVAALWAVLYVVSTAGEVLALRFIALVPLRLPAFTSLLSNQMWVLLLPAFLATRAAARGAPHTLPLRARLRQYLVCGLLTGVITILRNVAVGVITGSVFALLISTSILFSVGLSRLLAGAALNAWHYAAVAACLASACSVAGEALFTGREDVAGSDYPLGVPAALAAGAPPAAARRRTWCGLIEN